MVDAHVVARGWPAVYAPSLVRASPSAGKGKDVVCEWTRVDLTASDDV